MPPRPRYVGFEGFRIEEQLAKLGILGVVRHTDTNAYQCYPSLAAPISAAPAGSWVTPSTGTLVAAGGAPSAAYYLMGVASGGQAHAAVPNTAQMTILDTSTNVLRCVIVPAISANIYSGFQPIKVVGGRGLTHSTLGTGTFSNKALVLTIEPRIPHPSWCLEYTDLYQTGNILPATSGGTTLTSGGGAWTAGSYAQIVASSSAMLVMAVSITNDSGSTDHFDVDLATGGAGSESVVGTFGYVAGYDALYPTVFDLRAAPLYIPAGLRVAARAACANATQTCRIALEYLALPL